VVVVQQQHNAFPLGAVLCSALSPIRPYGRAKDLVHAIMSDNDLSPVTVPKRKIVEDVRQRPRPQDGRSARKTSREDLWATGNALHRTRRSLVGRTRTQRKRRPSTKK